MIDLTAMRLFGINVRESHLLTIRKALERTYDSIGYYRGFRYREENGYMESAAFYLMRNIGEGVISLTELVSIEENLWSADVEQIGRIVDKSGLSESRDFLKAFTENISKNKSIVSLLNEFSGVTIGKGSIVVRFRDQILKQMQSFRFETTELLKMIREHRQSILNAFHQFGEWAWQSTLRPVLHAGIYAVAVILVIVSVWFAISHGIVTSLQALGVNLVNSLRASLPIIIAFIFIACTIFEIAAGAHMLGPLADLLQQRFGVHSPS